MNNLVLVSGGQHSDSVIHVYNPSFSDFPPNILLQNVESLWHLGTFVSSSGIFCCSAQTLAVVCRLSSYGTWASHCGGFSYCGAQA